MAAEKITKIIVKNLPEAWTEDHLQNFLEVVTTGLTVADNGILLFRGITHTALVTLGEPVTGQSLSEDEQSLVQTPFNGKMLRLEAVSGMVCSVLVHYTDPQLTHDHIQFYFDFPDRSGCGNAAVADCEMYSTICVAVVHYDRAEGVTGVVSKGNHVLKQGSEVLKVEPWYEQFHRPLLNELIRRSRPAVKPPVAPKPTLPARPCRPPVFPKPSQSQEQSEVERPKEQNQKIKSTEAEKQQKAHDETVLQHKMENERLKNENEKLKKQVSVQISVPSHQLQLLTDFASASREGCKVTLLKQEEQALFHGFEEDCEEARREFLIHLQKLADGAILLSEPVLKILETLRGKRYVEDLVQRYSGCAAKVCNSQLLCAAVCDEKLSKFKTEFERNIMCRTCKVPPSLTRLPGFQALKLQLENEYMVVVTLPKVASSEDVQLDGISSDVELAVREVDKFTSLNRSDSTQFHIPGRLKGQACKKWFLKELDEAKQLILKNGVIEEESAEEGYTLIFQCRQEVLPTVLSKLSAIKDAIVLHKVDLNKAFHKYPERVLIINGLHDKGDGSFCSHLTAKLKDSGVESLVEFSSLPAIGALPQLRLRSGKASAGQRGSRGGFHRQWPHHSERSGGGSGHHHRGQHRSTGRHRDYPPLPCTCSVGGTTITIKSGDISAEQVMAAVCVVGQDLELKATAIGSAFLKKWPALAQALQTNRIAGGDSGECRLVTTTTVGSNLPMPFLFHAVLNKLPSHAVKKVVKGLVHQSLVLTVQNGQTSLALPPLGVGRRFGFGEYTTASVMAYTIKEFLQANPSALENISVVVYDVRLAGKFAQIISQKLGATPQPEASTAAEAAAAPPPPPPSVPQPFTPADGDDYSSDSDGDNDNDNHQVVLEEPDVSDLSESQKDVFEAHISTANASDCKQVTDILLKELNTTFLWHETLLKKDLDTFFELGMPILLEILQTAKKSNVHLSKCDKGLRLCGQKDCVNKLNADIQRAMLVHVQQQKDQVWNKRSQLGLPADTERLPSYWKVCRKEKDHTVSYDKALAAWQKRGVKLNGVTAEERAEIDRLMQATWEAEKAGAGNDAKNLSHTNIKLIKVQRLENPILWQEYSNRREHLFRTLEQCYSGSPPAQFTPVEALRGSRSPIQTTANIGQGSLLRRDIYPQVNEHYLFHGTKKDILHKIFLQGLDFRVASNRTMLGPGVYAAESSTKADQYADVKYNRASGEELTIILMRMLLGEPFIHKEQNPKPFKRPPCLRCSKQECSCKDSRLFNSVIDDATRIFREFVVYDQNVCYPEYIITYVRV